MPIRDYSDGFMILCTADQRVVELLLLRGFAPSVQHHRFEIKLTLDLSPITPNWN